MPDSMPFRVLTLQAQRLYCVNMADNKKAVRRAFSLSPFSFALCPLHCALCLLVLPFTFCLFRAEARSVDIGIGAGIQSYPLSLDPYEGLDHDPIMYPALDLHVRLIGSIAVTGHASRIKTENTLAGLIWCHQYVELYTLGFGVDYNFGTAVRRLKLGVQALSEFSDYTAGGSEHGTAHGYGLRVYMCTLQPITKFLSWGTRIGVQRLRIHPLSHAADCNLDSFHVDVMGYVSL